MSSSMSWSHVIGAFKKDSAYVRSSGGRAPSENIQKETHFGCRHIQPSWYTRGETMRQERHSRYCALIVPRRLSVWLTFCLSVRAHCEWVAVATSCVAFADPATSELHQGAGCFSHHSNANLYRTTYPFPLSAG